MNRTRMIEHVGKSIERWNFTIYLNPRPTASWGGTGATGIFGLSRVEVDVYERISPICVQDTGSWSWRCTGITH